MNGNNNLYPYAIGGYTNSNLVNTGGYNYAQPQNNTNNGVITVFVTSELAMQCYPVGAGNTVLLIDFDHHMFWIKSTDTNGVPMPIRTFNFNEKIEQPSTNDNQQVDNNAPTREEFEELKKMIKELME